MIALLQINKCCCTLNEHNCLNLEFKVCHTHSRWERPQHNCLNTGLKEQFFWQSFLKGIQSVVSRVKKGKKGACDKSSRPTNVWSGCDSWIDSFVKLQKMSTGWTPHSGGGGCSQSFFYKADKQLIENRGGGLSVLPDDILINVDAQTKLVNC